MSDAAQRLHPDEVPIDVALARRLLVEQAPDLAALPLRLVDAQGTDNVVLRLGDALAMRLPRKATAAASLSGYAGPGIAIGDGVRATVLERSAGFVRLRFDACDDVLALLDRGARSGDVGA